MEQPPAPQESLADVRREIDRIDDDILKLIAQRLDVVERVRASKARMPGGPASPIRPGREALILRRLIGAAQGRVPADLCFRIWRALISASTLKQAPVRIHGSAGFFASAGAPLLLREYFGASPFAEHADETAAFRALADNPGDLAAVAIDGPWAKSWLQGHAGPTQVIGVLPFLSGAAIPRLLIFGHAAAEPTGSDETLVLTDGQLPRDFAPQPLWQTQTGNLTLTSLPGFLSEENAPLAGLKQFGSNRSKLFDSNSLARDSREKPASTFSHPALSRSNGSLALQVLGRYPSPIEIGI